MIFDREVDPNISYEIVFHEFCQWYKEIHPEHEISAFPWYNGPFDGRLCIEDRVLVIRNAENGKYILISYWDRLFDFFLKYWKDLGQMVQIISSSGLWHFERDDYKEIYKDTTHIPFSYLPHKRSDQLLLEKLRIPFSEKKDCKPFFRGSSYDTRENLMNIDPETVTDKFIVHHDYCQELSKSKICLSLDGAGIICHRDMEILSLGSVLFRPDATPDSTIITHEQLLPDVHYVAFQKSDDPKEQLEIIKRKYEEIKNNGDFLSSIAHNGLEWYKRNGTIEANIQLLKKLVNTDVLA